MKTNQLKSGVVLSYIQIGINIIIQLLYTPVMIRILGKSEYGLYNLVASVVSYLNLFSLGFNGAYLRFYNRAKSRNDRNGIAKLNGMFLVLFTIMAFAAITCGGILTRFAPQLFGSKLTAQELQKAKVLMYILIVDIAFSFPSSVFDSVIAAHEKFIFQRIRKILGLAFNPLLCLPLLLMGYGSAAIVVTSTVITFASFIADIYYCMHKLHTQFYFQDFDLSLLKEIAVFSSFIFLNMLIDQVNWSVDKYILGRVSGTDSVAVYGVGAQLNSLVIYFSTSISSVFAPRINQIAMLPEPQRTENFDSLFIRVGRIQFMVLGLIVSGIVFFGRYFLVNIYVGPEYDASYYVALLLILPAVIPLIQNLGLEIQRSVNMHKARSVLYAFMAILNVIISIPLAIKMGPVGSALGTAISMILANGIFINIYYYKKIGLNIPAFWKSILSSSRGMVIPFSAAILCHCLFPVKSILQMVVQVVLYMIVYAISMYSIGCNQDEKKLVQDILYKFRRK